MAPLIYANDIITLRPLPFDMISMGVCDGLPAGSPCCGTSSDQEKMVNGRRQFCQKGDNLPGWSWIDEDNLLGRIESLQR
jgi:hypothetical protein